MDNSHQNLISGLASNAQSLVALSAILLSVCALGVSVYQAKIMRETQRATVWPFIEVLPSNNEAESSLGIYNKGIGPAIIKSISLTIEDRSFKSWKEIFNTYIPDHDMSFTWSTVLGRVLAPNDIVKAIQIERKDAMIIGPIMGKMKFEVCYCSVYDECWITDLSRSTKQTPACPIDAEDGFVQ